MRRTLLALVAMILAASAHATPALRKHMTPVPPQGNASAVYDLLERVLPGSSAHFELTLAPAAQASFTLSDGAGGKVTVVGTTASELSAGAGYYLQQLCGMTVGWPRGGGSHLFTPKAWPKIGSSPVSQKRNTPWSYIMNVCTHSYSLVWYGWAEVRLLVPALVPPLVLLLVLTCSLQWEAFIDWQSLVGINLNLAVTGQEEIQYQVFRKLGLNDSEIRGWFNGPAFLTWSRGQNEYGADVNGPLPRSWMKEQHSLQKRIVARYKQVRTSSSCDKGLVVLVVVLPVLHLLLPPPPPAPRLLKMIATAAAAANFASSSGSRGSFRRSKATCL